MRQFYERWANTIFAVLVGWMILWYVLSLTALPQATLWIGLGPILLIMVPGMVVGIGKSVKREWKKNRQ